MSIENRMRSIEAKRAQLIAFIADIDPERVAARPRPEKWSIQEIVEHLVLSESGVFGDLAELERRPTRRPRLNERVLYLVVMFILRFDIPVRVPSPAMIPKGGRAMLELAEQWESSHARLRAWISATDMATLKRPLFLHPVAGPMTTAQTMWMLEVHMDRHTRQIRALAKRKTA